MKQSPLHASHLALGARLAPFSGWELPIQYEGIAVEHRAVRDHCGVFDISHMGALELEGDGATDWLNRQLCNDLNRLRPGQGQYTLLLNETGGVIDDLIAYRVAPERYFLVVNAAKTSEDLDWLASRLDSASGIRLRDRSAEYAALAVQGPRSAEIWSAVAPDRDLPPRNGIASERDGREVLCRTGYTGEDGFELFVPAEEGSVWWDRFLAAGASPCGLGARDSLRLEKGYPLNGADLDPEHTPLEAGLGAFVALDKPGGFTGRDALLRQREAGLPSRLCAILSVGKVPPPRPGYPLAESRAGAEGAAPPFVASLTSGGPSPTLGQGIGLAYLPPAFARPGTRLDLIVRERAYPVEVVKKPFV